MTKTKRFHVSSEKHVLHMLTNLYSHPYTSVAREYIANAMDAHGDKPVTVRYNEFGNQTAFVDYGEGMTADEALDLFSGFGNTTKQDSTSTAGEFGVGAKSALAIVDEFGVVTTKNGITSELKIEKTDGTATVTVTAERPTDKPSGTTVLIPDPRRKLLEKAEKYAKFLDPTKVELGKWENVEWTDRVKFVPKGGLWDGAFTTVFIYRGLAYPMDYTASNTPWAANRKTIILLDDDAGVKVAPNRESFVSGLETNAILNAADNKIADDAQAYLLGSLGSLDPYDAAERILDDTSLKQVYDCFRYNEKFIINGVEIRPYGGMIKDGVFVEIDRDGSLTSLDRTQLRVGTEFTLVTGFDRLSEQYKKSSLRVYCNKQGLSGLFYFAESPVEGTVVTDTISKSEINKHKPTGSAGSAKPMILDGRGNPALVLGSKSESAPSYEWLDAMGVAVGRMHGNRIDKYCRSQTDYDHVFTNSDFGKFYKLDSMVNLANWLAFMDSMDSFEFVNDYTRSRLDRPLNSNMVRFRQEKASFFSTDRLSVGLLEIESGDKDDFKEAFEIYKKAKRADFPNIIAATNDVFAWVMETVRPVLDENLVRLYNALSALKLSVPGSVLLDRDTDANDFVYNLNKHQISRIAGLVYFHPSIDNQTTMLPDMLCVRSAHTPGQ